MSQGDTALCRAGQPGNVWPVWRKKKQSFRPGSKRWEVWRRVQEESLSKCISRSLPSKSSSPWTSVPFSRVQFPTSKFAKVCRWQPNFPFRQYSREPCYCFVNFLIFLWRRSSFCWKRKLSVRG
jgi:hypothetical protein